MTKDGVKDIKEGAKNQAEIKDLVFCRNGCAKDEKCTAFQWFDEGSICTFFEIEITKVDPETAATFKCGLPRPEEAPPGGMCFGRHRSWTLAARHRGGPWALAPLADLRSGDYVLSAPSPSGPTFVDRVWMNLHLRDTGERGMLE